MRVRAWGLVAVVCVAPFVAACGKGDNPWVVQVDRVDVALTITPHFPASGGGLSRPESINGLLALDVASGGTVTGSIAILGWPPTLAAVSGKLAGDRLALDSGKVGVAPGGTLAWERFTITVAAGASGAVDVGVGDAAGSWMQVSGDQIDQSDYTADLVLTADRFGEPVNLAPPEGRPFDSVLPCDGIQVHLGEPADAVHAANIRVLANGAPVTGSLAPTGEPVGGLVTTLALHAPGFWPFQAALSADSTGLTDPSGNPISFSGQPLHTVADPGSITANLGFESGMSGWIATGYQPVEMTGAAFGVNPAEGASQAVVHEGSVLAGYFDVAPDATSLSLSVALLSEIGQFDADRSAVVALHRASGERIVLFDAFAERASSTPCACGGDFGQVIAPVTKTVDLTPYRGERLWLTAEVKSSFFIGVNYFALVLDDLRLR